MQTLEMAVQMNISINQQEEKASRFFLKWPRDGFDFFI